MFIVYVIYSNNWACRSKGWIDGRGGVEAREGGQTGRERRMKAAEIWLEDKVAADSSSVFMCVCAMMAEYKSNARHNKSDLLM